MLFPVVKLTHALKFTGLCLFGCLAFYFFVSASNSRQTIIYEYPSASRFQTELLKNETAEVITDSPQVVTTTTEATTTTVSTTTTPATTTPTTTTTKPVSKKPIFVIKTFDYRKSKTFNGSDAVVTIFNGEPYAYALYAFVCSRLLKDGTLERQLGKVLDFISHPGVCRLGVMRLTCLFPPNEAELVNYSVSLVSQEGVTPFQSLTVSKPNTKPYKFVSCMSRMVAVDDWAMLIFAMETFRYFGGDLAVAPVECAIKEVMDLLRLYEKDGILKIQAAFKPKQIPELDYNPLTETEYANQVSNSHECFYDFKESAEFISFPDWDDILVGQQKQDEPISYYDTFAPFIKYQPNAAAFSLERINTILQTPVHESEIFRLSKILNKAVQHPQSSDHKMVLRPHLVAGCWIHSSKVMEDGAHYEINTTVAAFSHLQYTLLSKLNKTVAPGDSNRTFVDPDALDDSFRGMLKRQKFEFKNSNYPFVRLFHGLISDCYGKIRGDFGENGINYCPTPTLCKYKSQNVTVVKARTTFRNSFTMGPFVWVERSGTEFVTDNKGCL